MAGFNEILVGRFNKALNALFGIKSGAPSPSLAGDLTPVFTLDEPGRVDLRYLEGWNKYGIWVFGSAGAANTGGARIRNPITSGVICVLEKVKFEISTAAAGPIDITFTYQPALLATDLTSIISAQSLDGRNNVAASACVISASNGTVNPPALTTNIDTYRFQTNPGTQIFDILFLPDQLIPILPGGGLQCASNVATVDVLLTLWFRERVLEPSELR